VIEPEVGQRIDVDSSKAADVRAEERPGSDTQKLVLRHGETK
jgi:hypothetical protein